jgi:Ca2+-binding EF-hand superfamily protein
MKHKSIAALTLGSTLVLAAAGAVAIAGDGADGKHHGRAHGGPGKHFFAEMDANQDGKVTRDEAKSASDRLFQKLDLNKDGSITQAEAREGMKALGTERAAQRFAAKDTNKDGKLSAEESKMPAERFTRIDANKDGFLTQEELAQKFQPRADGPRGKFGARQFERMDADKNGTVTKAEAVAVAEQRFAKVDVNGDGVITQDELKSAVRHKRGGKPPAAAESKQ